MPQFTLYHGLLDPASRFVRLCLAECAISFDAVTERPEERRPEFLRLNPAGHVPVLVEDNKVIVGAGTIAEYLDETLGSDLGSRRLLPADALARAEVRRLVEWFNVKFHDEVSHLLVHEKVIKRSMRGGNNSPNMAPIRSAKANIRHHLNYIGFLMHHRSFLAGDWLSIADLAAAAHLSTVDYFGDVPWDEDAAAKTWFARIKSRPSFRPLLVEQWPGLPPAAHYADLDF